MADDTSCDTKDADGEGMCYENDVHQKGVLEMMKLMYDSRQLTDICISVDDQKFFCHRAVLAASSCYFHAMFTTSLAESRQSDIRLHDVDAESVNALIDYAYTGRVRITPFNVQNLMVTASVFQVCCLSSLLFVFQLYLFILYFILYNFMWFTFDSLHLDSYSDASVVIFRQV